LRDREPLERSGGLLLVLTVSGAPLVINAERVRFGLQHSEGVPAAKASAAKVAAARQAAAKQAAATHVASAAQPTQAVATQQTSEPSGSPEHVAEPILGQFGWSSSPRMAV
jgi:hypothetical protein